MRKTLVMVLMLAAATTLLSCSKSSSGGGGNTDVANDYVGNYILTDTTSYVNPNNSADTIKSYPQSSGSISKISANTVQLHGMPQFVCDTMKATVTTTSLVLQQGNCTAGGFPANYVCTKQGNTLYYSYYHYAGVSVLVRGKAVKQM
jgi:hypothetical protein